MLNKEINTTASLPDTKYETSERTFESVPDANVSQSNFIEIDFPKSRTVKFSEDKDVVRFSVNYEKVEEQLKNYESNTTKI